MNIGAGSLGGIIGRLVISEIHKLTVVPSSVRRSRIQTWNVRYNRHAMLLASWNSLHHLHFLEEEQGC
jgi:hypothetical protein